MQWLFLFSEHIEDDAKRSRDIRPDHAETPGTRCQGKDLVPSAPHLNVQVRGASQTLRGRALESYPSEDWHRVGEADTTTARPPHLHRQVLLEACAWELDTRQRPERRRRKSLRPTLDVRYVVERIRGHDHVVCHDREGMMGTRPYAISWTTKATREVFMLLYHSRNPN